jgi:hypothetical protein
MTLDTLMVMFEVDVFAYTRKKYKKVFQFFNNLLNTKNYSILTIIFVFTPFNISNADFLGIKNN